MDVLALDRWATARRGWLHRLPAGLKLAGVAGIVAFLVLVHTAVPLAALYAALLLALLTSRLPVLPILGLSAVPVALSGLFALSRLDGGATAGVVVTLKGAITSLTMLLLVASTPHTVLLRLARRALPAVLAELLFLGYRSVFIVLLRVLAARDALRLRGGKAPLPTRLQRGALVGGLAMLRATELATDQYAALRLRQMPSSRFASPLPLADRPPKPSTTIPQSDDYSSPGTPDSNESPLPSQGRGRGRGPKEVAAI